MRVLIELVGTLLLLAMLAAAQDVSQRVVEMPLAIPDYADIRGKPEVTVEYPTKTCRYWDDEGWGRYTEYCEGEMKDESK